MVQDIWNKFNANERMVAVGAIVVLVSWIVGVAGAFGIGTGTLPLVGAIAVLVIYYLKYAPNQNVNWPAPVPLIVLGISGVVALIALLGALSILGALGALSIFGLYTIAVIGTAVGAVIMAWFAWQEYGTLPKTTTPPSSNDSTSSPPPSSNPPA